MNTVTALELAKITSTRNEQVLVCEATKWNELKEYSDAQWNWLVENLVYSYSDLEKGSVSARLIKVEQKNGDFVAGVALRLEDGKWKRIYTLSSESQFNSLKEQFTNPFIIAN